MPKKLISDRKFARMQTVPTEYIKLVNIRSYAGTMAGIIIGSVSLIGTVLFGMLAIYDVFFIPDGAKKLSKKNKILFPFLFLFHWILRGLILV